jgi:translation elongation factor EF-4
MTFLLNGKPVDALALVVHRSVVQEVGKAWVTKLRKQLVVPPLSFSCELFAFPDKVIPRQMFDVPIQASIGHYERKLKHLVNQKESKKKMKRVGSVDLPQEAFFDILRSKPS